MQGKGIITKPIKYALKSPLLTGAGLVWARGINGYGEMELLRVTDRDSKKTGGQHGPFDHTDKKKIKKAQARFC